MNLSKCFDSGGYALVTALIFLVLLTLVALAAIRGSGLEAKMSANNAARTEAFESSELPRAAVTNLIDALCYADGWPSAIGGDATTFTGAIPTGLGIVNDSGGKPRYWCNENWGTEFEPDKLAKCGTTDSLFTEGCAANFRLNYPSGSVPPASASIGDVVLNADLAVHRLYVTGAPGAGQAQVYGYAPPGISAAGGGGNIFFYINSHGTQNDASGAAKAGYNTSTAFRYVIRN